MNSRLDKLWDTFFLFAPVEHQEYGRKFRFAITNRSSDVCDTWRNYGLIQQCMCEQQPLIISRFLSTFIKAHKIKIATSVQETRKFLFCLYKITKFTLPIGNNC